MRTVWITRQGKINQNSEASTLFAHMSKALAVERAKLDGFKAHGETSLMINAAQHKFRRFEALDVLDTLFEGGEETARWEKRNS